ncbi:MAG: NADH-quinone oxidoreductase subunit L [Candidatus Eisenbacteria bacterium]
MASAASQAMASLFAAVVLLPFAGFAFLVLFGGRIGRNAVRIAGAGSIGLSFAAALGASLLYAGDPGARVASLGAWIDTAGLRAGFDLRLDALSLVMILAVTFVGLLIHLYATRSMEREDGFSRFFAYMNLFVGSMLALVLADDLLLLFLGWEGVGLCSYLLIGFWYREPENGTAAQKAFLVTRIGDAAMAIGLFLLFADLGSLRIPEVLERAAAAWGPGDGRAALAAALLLGGALGKSGQIPLQVWLPDAMAGPTPVSALIHAATMVTAGVYLIARMHLLFALAPAVLFAVAVIGAATALYGSIAAFGQADIKRILAYSTISQIGYMFLALGVGAWTAAIFHLVTHAFFKALLFLAAGAVIDATGGEHDIFRMGGLRHRLPKVYALFLIGAASLAALPLVTAGFYSKDRILEAAWTSPAGGIGFYLVGLLTALLTAIYIFRAVFAVFHGEERAPVEHDPHHAPALPAPLMIGSMAVLAFFAIFSGFLGMPAPLGGFDPIGRLLAAVFPAAAHEEAGGAAVLGLLFSAVVALAGVAIAWRWQRERPGALASPAARGPLGRFLGGGLGFDAIYGALFVVPYRALAYAIRGDAIDAVFTGLARVAAGLNGFLSWTQNGRVRAYATGLLIGAIVCAAVLLLHAGGAAR